MSAEEAMKQALLEAITAHVQQDYGPSANAASVGNAIGLRLRHVPDRAFQLMCENAAPVFAATPTESGASPEGNDGDPGAAVPSREEEQ